MKFAQCRVIIIDVITRVIIIDVIITWKLYWKLYLKLFIHVHLKGLSFKSLFLATWQNYSISDVMSVPGVNSRWQQITVIVWMSPKRFSLSATRGRLWHVMCRNGRITGSETTCMEQSCIKPKWWTRLSRRVAFIS